MLVGSCCVLTPASMADLAEALRQHWLSYVSGCEGACCVVGTDGNILAANGALASRVGCTAPQLILCTLRRAAH